MIDKQGKEPKKFSSNDPESPQNPSQKDLQEKIHFKADFIKKLEYKLKDINKLCIGIANVKEQAFQETNEKDKIAPCSGTLKDLEEFKINELLNSELPNKNKLLKPDLKDNFKSEEVAIRSSDDNNKQVLINICKDLDKMPNGFERKLLEKIDLVLIILNEQSVADKINILKAQEEIEDLIFSENLGETERSLCPDIKGRLNKAYALAKQQNWKSVHGELKYILEKLRPLSLQEIFRLANKSEDAVKRTENQDVMFLLGSPRSKKLPMITFLADSKLVEPGMNDPQLLVSIETSNLFLKNDDECSFKILEFGNFVSVLTVPVISKDNKPKRICVCATGIFENDQELEVTIATVISIVNMAQQCKTIKPVVLISHWDQEDKLINLKEIVRILVQMIPEFGAYTQAFSCIFINHSGEEKTRINEVLENILKIELNEMPDQEFVTFLTELFDKSEKKLNVVDFTNPQSFLKKFTEAESPGLPKEAFKFKMPEKAKFLIKEQLNRHQKYISASLTKSDFQLIKYKLEELIQLQKLINEEEMKEIKQVYQECVSSINAHLRREYHVTQGVIRKLKENLRNENELTNEDVLEYQARMDFANKAECLKDIDLDLANLIMPKRSFLENINSEIEIILTDLEARDINDLISKKNLEKLDLLAKSFPDVRDKYDNACKLMKNRCRSQSELLKDYMATDQFDKYVELMATLSSFRLKDNDNEGEIQVNQFKESLLSSLMESIERGKQVLNKERLDKTDIDILNKIISIIELAQNTRSMNLYLNIEELKTHFSDFLQKIVAYLNGIKTKIKTQFDNLRERPFQAIKLLLEEIILLQGIPNVFQSASEMLDDLIKDLRKNIKQLLESIFKQTEDNNSEEITGFLRNLETLKSSRDVLSDIYSGLMNYIKEQFTLEIEDGKIFLKKIDISFKHHDNVETLRLMLLNIINRLKAAMQFFPDLAKEINFLTRTFEGKIRAALESISILLSDLKKFFFFPDINFKKRWSQDSQQDPEVQLAKKDFFISWREHQRHFDLEGAENAFKYLKVCSRLNLRYERKYIPLLGDLSDLLHEYSDYVKDEMRDCFNDIINEESTQQRENNAEILYFYMERIHLIKKSYVQVYAKFDLEQRIIAKWKMRLAHYAAKLSSEMDNLHKMWKHKELHNKILILKALIPLDDFLDENKFENLFFHHKRIFYSTIKEFVQDLIKAVQSGDYRWALCELPSLEQIQDDFVDELLKEMKKELNSFIRSFIQKTEEALSLISWESYVIWEKIEPVVLNLNELQHIKTVGLEYLDDSEILDGIIMKIKETIRLNVYLVSVNIERLAHSSNSYKAEKMKDSLRLIRLLLRPYCEQHMVNKPHNAVSTEKEILEEKDDLEKKFNDGLAVYDLKDFTDLIEDIQYTKNKISKLENDKRHKKAAESKDHLRELENLQSIYEKITVLKDALPGSLIAQIQILTNEFEESLAKRDLKDVDALMKEIDENKKDINTFKKKERNKKVAELNDYVVELESIRALYDKITTLKMQQTGHKQHVDAPNKELKGLEKELEGEPEELPANETIVKKGEIAEFEIGRRQPQLPDIPHGSIFRKKKRNKDLI